MAEFGTPRWIDLAAALLTRLLKRQNGCICANCLEEELETLKREEVSHGKDASTQDTET